ncbi:LNG1/LNG2 family protein, partial [Shewanella sp. A3A]|nr:LNG1/LNG2 family protein [Shewanella ferrihydritica]
NFFGCDPWVAYPKHSVRPAPVGTGLIQEVDNCIDSLVSDEVPSTLDRVVLKDLESGSWMDLRVDTEEVAIEVWDTLLDDLLEEMVFDL